MSIFSLATHTAGLIIVSKDSVDMFFPTFTEMFSDRIVKDYSGLQSTSDQICSQLSEISPTAVIPDSSNLVKSLACYEVVFVI